MPQTKVAPVDVGFDREFIEKWLDRQRYVWYSVILFLALSFSGILGRGPLAKETVSAGPGQLRVTYERFPHYKTPAVIELHLPEKAATGGHVFIRLEGAIVDKAAFQQIIPQPFSANPLERGIVVDIPTTTASMGGRVLIVQQPSAVGTLETKIGIEGSSPLSFKQFVLR